MAAEKRRSDRLMLTIPLQVHGTDTSGKDFRDDAHTIALNRHGARIFISRPLRRGQNIILTNLAGRREAEFRVVGPVSPVTDQGGEWAVECCDLKENIWGIQFPPMTNGGGESNALLECRNCHTVALMRLSLVEVDVLETSGILSKTCGTCRDVAPWGYAEAQVAMGGPSEEAAMMAEARTAARGGPDQRRHRRVALQLPVMLRDYYGGMEITRTENVSKGGFCFVSEKTYHVGEGMMVVCPYNPAGENIEVRARIVRRHAVDGTKQSVYGIRYDVQTA
jgi:hypothetical protein